MNEIGKHLVTAFGTAGVVIAFCVFAVYRYVDRRLKTNLEALQASLTGAANTATSLRMNRLSKTAELIPLVQAAASHCRNAFQDVLKTPSGMTIRKYNEERESFVDALYAAQVLLRPNTYERVHILKGVFDNVSLYLGDEGPDWSTSRTQSTLTRFLNEIDECYAAVVTSLHADLRSLEGLGT